MINSPLSTLPESERGAQGREMRVAGLVIGRLDLLLKRPDGSILLMRDDPQGNEARWMLPGFIPESSDSIEGQIRSYCENLGLRVQGDPQPIDFLERPEVRGGPGMRLLFCLEVGPKEGGSGAQRDEMALSTDGCWFASMPGTLDPETQPYLRRSRRLFETKKSRFRSFRQLLRYLIVGGWNTLFGYGTYAGLTYLLTPYWEGGYLVASLLAGFLNITVSFLGYKWWVFRTQGHYLKEWSKALMVYGGGVLLNTLLLAPLVLVIQELTGDIHSAPYLAGAMLLVVTVILSFFGHRHFTFRRSGQ